MSTSPSSTGSAPSRGNPSPGKRRASTIALDYVKRPDRMQRGRQIVSLFAGVAAVGSTLWMLTSHGGLAVAHGPVASVHSAWETKCDACHDPFVPIRDDAWFAVQTSGGSPWRVADQKCQACHAGSAHYASEPASAARTCSSCHHEHQGKHHSLIATGDRSCTACHGRPFEPTGTADDEHRRHAFGITRFDLQHPEFRSLDHDPGAIKFSHYRHMLEGLAPASDDKSRFTLANLPEADRPRYRPDDSPAGAEPSRIAIQLKCASCHQLDVGDQIADADARSSRSLPASGAYMLPIRYDRHCQACHPLPLEAGSAEQAPHGRDTQELRDVLRGRVWERLLRQQPELNDQPRPQFPLPRADVATELSRAGETAAAALADSERHLRVVCSKCHQFEPSDDRLLGSIQPSNVPTVWLQKSRFDHAAHRAVQCRDCHPRAEAHAADASRVNTDVLIVGKAVCVQCHAAPSADGLGGVSHECSDCHRYHGADNPFHGRGSRDEDGREDFPWQPFLRGIRAEGGSHAR